MSKTYIKLFKNDKKIEGDSQPLYSNSKVTVKENIELKVGGLYSAAIWKNEDGSLNFKIELKEEQPTQQYMGVQTEDI